MNSFISVMKHINLFHKRIRFLGIVVFLLFSSLSEIAAKAICQNGEFYAPHRFRVGELLSGGAIADFNRDGKADAVIVDNYSSNVAIFSGDGSGNFGAPKIIRVGLLPVAAGAGDFNGDGNADFVTANGGNSTLSVFLGSGNGDFSTQAVVPVSGSLSALSVQDLNRDGFDDVAVTIADENRVVTFNGAASGSLSAGGSQAVGQTPQAVVRTVRVFRPEPFCTAGRSDQTSARRPVRPTSRTMRSASTAGSPALTAIFPRRMSN